MNGNAAVTRQCGGERVEDRGERWRRGLNHAVSDCDGDSVIESNFGHGGGEWVGENLRRCGQPFPVNLLVTFDAALAITSRIARFEVFQYVLELAGLHSFS